MTGATPREPGFEALLDHIHAQRGVNFGAYKASTLRRRIAKRMQAVGVDSYEAYQDHLQASPDEFGPLLDAVFINVTRFFRDAEAWERIEAEVVPAILEERGGADGLRVWCAGVASGQEAYSLAMILADRLGPERYASHVKIFATDVDEDVLQAARSAVYPGDAMEHVSPARRERWFRAEGPSVQVSPELRRSVVFGHHDLLADAPISRLDLLVCRNTLMYFTREAQGRILSRFHFALRDTGYLFLGRAEMLLTRRTLFTPVANGVRVFRKTSELSLQDRLTALAMAGDGGDDAEAVMSEVQLRDLALESGAVAELVVAPDGTLALANQRARTLFGLAPSDIGKPFQDLEVSFRPVELRGPLERARDAAAPVELTDVEYRARDGEERFLDVRVLPLLDGGAVVAVKIVFHDVTRHRVLSDELGRSRKELEVAYEELQSTNEELETTNEELQSTVEELETTNEELQSTNEELETMNEELQSTNVEIETVNEELRERTADLGAANRYIGSILNSLQQAVVVLDAALNVRMWNDRAEDLWGLRDEDVEGRAFLGLDIGLPVHEVRDQVRACAAGDDDHARVTVLGHDRRGKPVEHHVSCMPLLEADGAAAGVIVMVEGRAGEG